MANKKPSVGFLKGLGEFINPTQCLNDIVNTWTNYLRTSEEEKTKRREIEAWEEVRYPQRSWWLDECDRPKGGCPRWGVLAIG